MIQALLKMRLHSRQRDRNLNPLIHPCRKVDLLLKCFSYVVVDKILSGVQDAVSLNGHGNLFLAFRWDIGVVKEFCWHNLNLKQINFNAKTKIILGSIEAKNGIQGTSRQNKAVDPSAKAIKYRQPGELQVRTWTPHCELRLANA